MNEIIAFPACVIVLICYYMTHLFALNDYLARSRPGGTKCRCSSISEIDVLPVYGENYDKFYATVDYRGKRVLDIGADYGSTVVWMLKKGATKVIAVEPDPDFFKHLIFNTGDSVRVEPVRMRVSNPKHVEYLIRRYKPDIVKIDCEGCEINLVGVDNKVLRIPESYVIEVHSESIRAKVIEKMKEAGFELVHDNPWTTEVSILTFVRRI